MFAEKCFSMAKPTSQKKETCTPSWPKIKVGRSSSTKEQKLIIHRSIISNMCHRLLSKTYKTKALLFTTALQIKTKAILVILKTFTTKGFLMIENIRL